MATLTHRLRRLDNAAFRRTESARLKDGAVIRHVVLGLLAGGPILAWDFGVGAPQTAWNVAVGLLYVAPVLAWREHPVYRLWTALLATVATLVVIFGVIYGVGLLFVPAAIGTWLSCARPPTRW